LIGEIALSDNEQMYLYSVIEHTALLLFSGPLNSVFACQVCLPAQ
jgi:hypothetical protein